MNTDYWKNATPEQINLWTYASGLIAYNTITPLFFKGAIAGSEFLTYAASKVYMALHLQFGGAGLDADAGGAITLYKGAATIEELLYNTQAAYNGTNLDFEINLISIKNTCFTYLTASKYAYVHFNGYRLTIV